MRNQEQIDFWNGPRGASWVAEQGQRDRSLAPFGEAALRAARPAPGERVVDVGCGCGTTSLALAAAVGPRGAVLGVDVSGPMLARARETATGVPQLRFEQADAASFAFDGTASLVFSRFGVMFFDDPRAAFENLRRALVPGGRLTFACWRGLAVNDWLSVPLAAVRSILPAAPQPAAPDAPGPLSLADPARLRAVLEGAGFEGLAMAAVDHAMPLGDGASLESAAAEAVTLGPTARLLAGADDATRARATAAVAAALAAHAHGGAVRLAGSAWLVTAHAPGG
ncbi:MAG: class I SAM-dependent methyltransferase [Deltaproteobacteria bacterium]